MIGQYVVNRKRSRGAWGLSAAKRMATSPAAAAGASWAAGKYFGVGRKVQSGTHGSGVSLQRDRTVQYVSKHKPGWKRRARRMKKFRARVNAVLLKNHGKLTTILDDFYAPTSSAGTQLFQAITLGGMYGAGTGENDINTIIAAAVSQSTDASRILIDSMVLDLQITTTEATESSCELDVYEFVCTRDVPNTIIISGAVADVTMSNFFSRGLTTQPVVNVTGGTQLANTTLGMVPFDNKFWCKHFKVIKKTKYLLGLNQYITYQIRAPKNKFVVGYQRRDLLARKGLTRGVILMAKGLVSGGAVPSTDLAVYSNRHYNYTVLQNQTDAAETR